MRIFLFSLLLLPLGFFPKKAQADYMLKTAFSYTSHSTDSSTGTRMIYDIMADYRFAGGGWVTGATYQSDAQGGDTSTSRTSYGANAGWMDRKEFGLYLIGTYYISSNYTDFSGGSGYQADLGYKFTPKKTAFSMQFSYKHYSYTQPTHTDTYIDPYFALIFEF